MAAHSIEELILFNPCDLGDDAYRFAKHGRHIVEKAKKVEAFDEAIADIDLIIGTSGIPTENQKKFLRHPMTPKEFIEHIGGKDGRIGLVFGREDQGFRWEDTDQADGLGAKAGL